MSLKDKFKATSMDVIKNQKELVNQVAGERKQKVDYIEIEDGVNKIRIFPAHPGKSSYIYPRSVYWVPAKCWIDEDGKEIYNPKPDYIKEKKLKQVVRNKPVFNAKVHAHDKKYDIIDSYIKIAKQCILEIKDDKRRTELLEKLYHWKNGIPLKTSWISYAKKIKAGGADFGYLELTPGTKDKLDDLSIQEEASEAISVDPFTDPETGLVVQINYNSKAKKAADYYKVNFSLKGVSLEMNPLTEEELEVFINRAPLEDILVNSYRKSDFVLALNGVQMFDEANGIGAFENEEFLELAEKLADIYPEKEAKEETETIISTDDDDAPEIAEIVEEDSVNDGEAEVEEPKVEEKVVEKPKAKVVAKAEPKVEEKPVEKVEEKPAATGESIQDKLAALRKKHGLA